MEFGIIVGVNTCITDLVKNEITKLRGQEEKTTITPKIPPGENPSKPG